MTVLVLCRHVRAGDAAHAASLAETLAEVGASAVYTSPLARARKTADAVAAPHGVEPVVVEDLREIDLGEVEGLGFDELPPDLQRGLLEEPTSVRFPGGETYAELRARVIAALDTLAARHEGATAIVVTHAGPIRAALASWLLMDDAALFRLDQRYGAVNVVELIAETPLVRLVNAEQLR